MKLIDDLFKDAQGLWDISRVGWGWSIVSYTGVVIWSAIHDPSAISGHLAEIAGGYGALLAAGGFGVKQHSQADV